MAPESKVVFDPYDIFGVFMVLVTKVFKDLYFDLALFVQLLPVLQHLNCDSLVRLVVKALNDDSKRSSAQLLLDFVPEVDMVFRLVQVICLIVVKPKVVDAIFALFLWGLFVLACQFTVVVPANALKLGIQIKIVDCTGIHHLFFFKLRQLFAEVLYNFFTAHWKTRSLLRRHFLS